MTLHNINVDLGPEGQKSKFYEKNKSLGKMEILRKVQKFEKIKILGKNQKFGQK